jgi:hypothetical protein
MEGSHDDRSAFSELLAPYDLRNGHDPTQRFDAGRDYVGRGWHGLIKELIEDLIRLGWDRGVLQIKEKFGTLRFHVKDRRPEYLDRIEVATDRSGEICESCAKPGSLRASGTRWYTTRCERCAEH